ncbi:MAG: hypothetical protein ACJAXA_003785, partial [Candidatus Aldehydirespiratoraceae bacterium]
MKRSRSVGPLLIIVAALVGLSAVGGSARTSDGGEVAG